MKIGIIGAGNVGGTLGRSFAKLGHEVVFGVRDPSGPKVAELLSGAGGNARAASIADAAAFGEVVLFATPWDATKDAVEAAGDLAGKIVLDATNPLRRDLNGLDVAQDTSGGEIVQGWAKGARVVKIFNTTGAENMGSPRFEGGAATMLYAGDDDAAKEIAAKLATELGFDALDAGPLAKARLLEHLAALWVHLAYGRKQGRGIAFRLMRR